MQTIPPTPETRAQILKNYITTQNDFLTRHDQVQRLAYDDDHTSLTEPQRDLLAKISEAIDESRDLVMTEKNSLSGGIVNDIIDQENGLDLNHQNVLVASLNGVQKAYMSFLDTVATVFGVDTKQAA